MISGEPLPVSKKAGDQVIGGTVNQTGGFVMRAGAVGKDTMLSKIVQMVAEAQRSRAPIQRLADQVAAWFRSEEHTSELQSLMRISYAVLCLKKQRQRIKHKI